MTSSMEIGSIIGGRYRVTAHVVSSAEGDDVLSGLDQVLNRNVSILVAAKKNASQASQSGRELATGERQSSIQVLDMVITDGRPALVTNTARADELLDLLVSQDQPYVEPFFTESLGSEIFGQKREAVPEVDSEWDEHYYDMREDKPLIDLSSMTERARAKAAERAAARDAAAAEKARAEQAKASAAPEELSLADRDAQYARLQEESARVQREQSIRMEEGRTQNSRPSSAGAAGFSAGAAAGAAAPSRSSWGLEQAAAERSAAQAPSADDSLATQAVPQVAAPGSSATRRPSVRPLGPATGEDEPNRARSLAVGSRPQSNAAAAAPLTGPAAASHAAAEHVPNTRDSYRDEDLEEEDYDDADSDPRRRTFSRLLVGLLLGALLLGAVVLATTQLGSLFKDGAFTSKAKPSAVATESATPTPTPKPAAKPVIAGIQRLVPSNPTLDSGSDPLLGRIVDGDRASSWGSLVYQNPQFGNLTKNFAFIIELKSPADVKKLKVLQSYGNGGSFEVLVNDAASLDGAQRVGSGTFDGNEISVPLTGGSPKKYVIVNVTELPRLSGVQAVYPWGMIINEMSVE